MGSDFRFATTAAGSIIVIGCADEPAGISTLDSTQIPNYTRRVSSSPTPKRRAEFAPLAPDMTRRSRSTSNDRPTRAGGSCARNSAANPDTRLFARSHRCRHRRLCGDFCSVATTRLHAAAPLRVATGCSTAGRPPRQIGNFLRAPAARDAVFVNETRVVAVLVVYNVGGG